MLATDLWLTLLSSVSFILLSLCENGTIRFSGDSSFYGCVEVHINNIWGTILEKKMPVLFGIILDTSHTACFVFV